jgi:quercetin dioxygenase-like cupin family protein
MRAGRLQGCKGINKVTAMRPIDRFLNLAGAEVAAAATGPARSAGARVAELLAQAPEPAQALPPQRLPVCRHLSAACTSTKPNFAEAFGALEPQLAWRIRAMHNASPDFAHGHASARVLNPNGLEQRGGLVAGFSLVAPGITYPEHNHPPEEIYLVLSSGEWWQAGGAWQAYGPGGIVHNPPGIKHAMRGMSVPLLAIWFLLPV